MDIEQLDKIFRQVVGPVEFASLRYFSAEEEWLGLQKQHLLAPRWDVDRGVMIQVMVEGGEAYAATDQLTLSGIRSAYQKAVDLAKLSSSHRLPHSYKPLAEGEKGEYASPQRIPWKSIGLKEKIQRMQAASQHLAKAKHAVDWEVSFWSRATESHYLATNGAQISQRFHQLTPHMSVTASDGNGFQTRSFGREAFCSLGGWERLDVYGFDAAAPQIAEEVAELLAAPNCPTGNFDIVVAADQMVLQIHESIGHPLELDRILGDERNYAGTSFVTPDMFGSYQYGSSLLNVVYDPEPGSEVASFAFDDAGMFAERQYIIKDGLLVRGLGGARSGVRLDQPAVACERSCSWNRPPIDRMANLNLLPGDSSLEQLISQVESGVYFQTNNSWSIDDSRNKFQFGCERAQLIENGQLTKVVKNPGYRGISAEFWRNLKAVGDPDTMMIMGTPYCGKGEPNQAINVGHASPACLFSDVEVFGGIE